MFRAFCSKYLNYIKCGTGRLHLTDYSLNVIHVTKNFLVETKNLQMSWHPAGSWQCICILVFSKKLQQWGIHLIQVLNLCTLQTYCITSGTYKVCEIHLIWPVFMASNFSKIVQHGQFMLIFGLLTFNILY